MANENEKIGPNLEGSGRSQVKQTVSDIKDMKREQGDFNDTLKDSINLLRQVQRSYEGIEARLETMNKTTINIKQINQEIARAKQQEFSTARKIELKEQDLSRSSKNRIDNYLKSQSQVASFEKKLLEARRTGDISLIKAAENQLNRAFSLNEIYKSRLDISEAELISLIQSNKIAQESVKIGQDKLAEEKELQSKLGLQGYLLKVLNKYLLVGKDTYGKMVEEARNGEANTKKHIATVAILSAAVYGAYKAMKSFADIAKTGLDALTQSGGPVSKFVSPFTNLIKQIPIVGGLLGSIADAGANIIDFATGATSKIEEFARSLGLSFSQAKAINQQFDQIARNSGQAFLTVEKLTNSQLELSKALGINNVLSESILKDNLQLQEQLGLELETRKQLAQITLISDVSQTKIFKTILGQVEAIRRTVGVNLRVQDVIAKISQLSGVVGLTFAKYPEKLAKSLAITKALGLDFQKLDSIASGLLDFESSIASEFEAQLLTGRDINLGKARQLALDNDLTGLAVELNKQLGSSQEFINMNRISQESYAKALGMSRDEIADMLRQQEMFAAAGATDLKTFKMRVAEMERAGTLQSEFLSKLGEEQAQLFLNSTATEKIANFFDKIKQSFATLLSSEGFKSFIDTFLNKLADPNFITGIINKLSTFVSLLLNAVAAIVDAADVVANAFSLGSVDISNDIPNKIRSYANSLGSVSIGGKVASAQVSTAGVGSATVSGVAASSTGQAINLTVQTVVDDHARKAEQRISMAPKADYQTGPYGKK